MATIKKSKEDTLKHLNDKVSDGKILLAKCQNLNNQNDYVSLVDEHANWWKSSGNLLRQLFTDEKISEDFLHIGFTSFDRNASFYEKINSFSQNIISDLNKLEIIIKDVAKDLYKPEVNSAMTNPIINAAKIELWKAVIIALITAAAGIFTTYLALPEKPATAIDKQGLGNLSIQGKWLYECTDYNGKYQHGGRFKVSKQTSGSLQLNGERMWKDTQDEQLKKWVCNEFKGDKILPWKSHWIYVHDDNQFNMEYEITVDGRIIKGYCNGDITSENNDVQKIEGYFYQLLPQTPLLAGRITFYKVTDNDYNNPVWRKNHNCE